MKKYIRYTITLLLFVTNAYTQDLDDQAAQDLLKDAQSFVKSVDSLNLDEVVDKSPPEMYENIGGGKEQYRKLLGGMFDYHRSESENGRGLTLLVTKITLTKEVTLAGKYEFVFLPHYMEVRSGDHIINKDTCIIALRSKGKTDWYFVDADNYGPTYDGLFKMFPAIPKATELPKRNIVYKDAKKK